MAELFAWVAVANCLLVAFVPMAQYPSWVVGLACALLMSMALCLRLTPNPVWCIHAMLGILMALIFYLLVHTGGLVSAMTVWLSMLALIPFLLLPIKQAFVWLSLQTLCLGAVLYLGLTGWSMGSAESPDMVVWAWVNKVLAAATLLGILVYLDHVQGRQLKVLQLQSDELKRTHEDLMRAQSHKDEFIASVGHELRTPMNAILGLNGVLKDHLAQNPKDLEQAELIRQSTQRLLTLVNEILDFSQLQARRMRLGSQPYALAMGVQALFARYEIPLYGCSRFRAHPELSAELAAAARVVLANAECHLGHETLRLFHLNAPQVHQGLVISGDQFVASAAASQALSLGLPDALAVEMEGAAVAQVCHDYAIPFAAVRTLSDRADDGASVDFTRFIQQVASRYSLAILSQWLTARVPG